MAVELTTAFANGSVDVPITVAVGDVHDAMVAEMTLEIRDGQAEDWRPVLAAALRELADQTERLPDSDDEEGVDDAAP